MTGLNGVICKQGQLLLGSKWHALFQVILLALLPYASWLSVAIVALVTLRRGWKDGGWLLVPAIIANAALSLASTTVTIAVVNALLIFAPCYLSSIVLRARACWSSVAIVLFLQIIAVVLLLQLLMPDFIMAQYLYLQALLREMQPDNVLLAFVGDKNTINPMFFASYLLGIQTVGVVFSAMISLIVARSIQSQLFYPGEFKREIMAFRCDKRGLLFLAVLLVAAYQQSVIAMSLLPMLLFYFVLSGISVSCHILAKRKTWQTLTVLAATLFFLPFIMLPVYVLLGSLDSVFNFRLYLPSDAGKTI
jgi:hypothetical protein